MPSFKADAKFSPKWSLTVPSLFGQPSDGVGRTAQNPGIPFPREPVKQRSLLTLPKRGCPGFFGGGITTRLTWYPLNRKGFPELN